MGSKNISDIKEVMNALGIKDFSQNNPHHFGTFEQHVGAVVNDDMIQNDKSGTKDLLKIAAIMHDIGKADVKDINPKTGYDRYIGHDKRSAEIFDENADKLFSSLSDDQKQYVHDLIALHHARYAKEGKCRDMLDSHPSGFAADLLKLDTADVSITNPITAETFRILLEEKQKEIDRNIQNVLNTKAKNLMIERESFLKKNKGEMTHNVDKYEEYSNLCSGTAEALTE